jgi:hypothetical protein
MGRLVVGKSRLDLLELGESPLEQRAVRIELSEHGLRRAGPAEEQLQQEDAGAARRVRLDLGDLRA